MSPGLLPVTGRGCDGEGGEAREMTAGPEYMHMLVADGSGGVYGDKGQLAAIDATQRIMGAFNGNENY
ncbi:hypothetical protein E2562_020856 [Oryza meyeriana var. granulata]|uniref:Uncharacterized protein n=1 Tax=Oryza meyeriana var. granulata TaxID=110450 RepID=A0A6G1D5U4_9ORYZ|nr:hypothetical protein E2562_020856 [Oryza meyeriana var. granulata]